MNKRNLMCSKNISLSMKKQLIKEYAKSIAHYECKIMCSEQIGTKVPQKFQDFEMEKDVVSKVDRKKKRKCFKRNE